MKTKSMIDMSTPIANDCSKIFFRISAKDMLCGLQLKVCESDKKDFNDTRFLLIQRIFHSTLAIAYS
jgi:hypothetical protein